MTETGKASDQNLTEDAFAPGNIQQSNTQECKAIYHDPIFARWWDCEKQYEGIEKRIFASRHRTLHPYEADVLYYQECAKKVPEHWCWCLRDHHHDYIRDALWDACKVLEAYRTKKDNATKYAKNGRLCGPRELTLTYTPRWYDDDTLAQEAFKKAVARLTKYYSDELLEFRAVGEYTAAGRSHLHCMYHLRNGGKFTDKNLKRAYPHWNPKKHEGGHHSLVKSKSDFSGYIEKDLQEAWMDFTYPNANDPSLPSPATGILEGSNE